MNRYLALDVLRGLTVALMIVVNTPGDWNAIYAPFRHSNWHGCTPTDLVFPTFLFVVGNALSFGMGKLRQLSHTAFLIKVGKRSLLIFLIGLLLNAFPFISYVDGHYVGKDLLATRLWGVLQRIAVCYGVAALLLRYVSPKGVIAVTALLLFGYWWLLWQFGDYTLEGNVIGRIDRLYLPEANIYRHYHFPFDPLGLLSTLPAIVNVIAGYWSGRYLQQKGALLLMGGCGLLLVVTGAAWGTIFPINKALWTSSYVVYCTGYDLLLLALLAWITGPLGLKRWTYFFEAFGKNPLFIYIVAWVVVVLLGLFRWKGPLYKYVFTSWLPPEMASLAFAVLYMLVMWVIVWRMDEKGLYVKV